MQQRMVHRDGILEIEDRYRDLLLGVETIISKEVMD
jgi:hypothetical protein